MIDDDFEERIVQAIQIRAHHQPITICPCRSLSLPSLIPLCCRGFLFSSKRPVLPAMSNSQIPTVAVGNQNNHRNRKPPMDETEPLLPTSTPRKKLLPSTPPSSILCPLPEDGEIYIPFPASPSSPSPSLKERLIFGSSSDLQSSILKDRILDAILGAPVVGGEGFSASLEEIMEGIWSGEERLDKEEEGDGRFRPG